MKCGGSIFGIVLIVNVSNVRLGCWLFPETSLGSIELVGGEVSESHSVEEAKFASVFLFIYLCCLCVCVVVVLTGVMFVSMYFLRMTIPGVSYYSRMAATE